MLLAEVGKPNCALVTVVFQLVKTTWFSALAESIRRSRLNRSFRRKVRPMEAFKVNWAGPLMVFLPAVPHDPAMAPRRLPDSRRGRKERHTAGRRCSRGAVGQ